MLGVQIDYLDRKGLYRQFLVAVNNHSHCIYQLTTTVTSNTLWRVWLSVRTRSHGAGRSWQPPLCWKHWVCHVPTHGRGPQDQPQSLKNLSPRNLTRRSQQENSWQWCYTKWKKRGEEGWRGRQGWYLCIIYTVGFVQGCGWGVGRKRRDQGTQTFSKLCLWNWYHARVDEEKGLECLAVRGMKYWYTLQRR